jgi:hypothetical protein
MSIGGLLQVFWNDGKVEILAILVALDFLLGVIAAIKLRIFRLSYVSDFVRKDVIFKVGGYLLVYAGAVYAGEADIIIDGLDLGVIAGAVYVVIVAAMVGSILNSLREIGLVPGTDPPPPAERDIKDMLTADERV